MCTVHNKLANNKCMNKCVRKMQEKKGHNFTIPGDIAPKISKYMPGILAMPHAIFYAIQ